MKRIRLYRLAIGVILVCNTAQARSWTEISSLHDPEPADAIGFKFLADTDKLVLHTPSPTAAPTTAMPTQRPSSHEAIQSPGPTLAPSQPIQIQSTTSPTQTPSAAPSSLAEVSYPPIEPPLNPDPWYYNYDTRRSSDYGPGYPSLQDINGEPIMGYNNNAWGKVDNPPYSYWDEFTTDNGFGPWKGVLQNRDILRNMCGRVGMQSPIDIRPSAGATCREHHQVRPRVRIEPILTGWTV